MRRSGVRLGLVLLIALCAACSSNAKRVAPTTVLGSASSTVAPSSSRPSLSPGIPVPTTLVAAHALPSGQIAHAIQIAEGIRATGNVCQSADIEIGPQNGTVGNPSKEQVSCEIGDDTIAISLFADHAALVRSTPLIRQGACFTATGQTSPSLTYVVGENWIVFPQHTTTARDLASRLDASLVTIHC